MMHLDEKDKSIEIFMIFGIIGILCTLAGIITGIVCLIKYLT